MRIHGWCTGCRKVKLVRVSGHGLAMIGARRIAQGICDDCERRAEDERAKRDPRRGPRGFRPGPS